jgi:glycolate oxidase FAD binding subunit
MERIAPRTREEAAAALASAGRVRLVGGGTKLGWGPSVADPEVELSTAGLCRIHEHNTGDLTAVIEAGVPLARAQEAFAEAGQMLALDPPLGAGEEATVGGVVASGDSGPLRHRHGSARDLVVGMTAALSDGTLATAGGKVIKNVAGYDLPKLFAGSLGTLGLIVQVVVRLHPRPPGTATVVAESADPVVLAGAAAALAHAPLELQGLDVRWEHGEGRVLARCAGAAPEAQGEVVAERLSRHIPSSRLVADDEGVWAAQRSEQRSRDGTVVRVSGLPSRLAAVLEAAECVEARVVGRAALGISWIALEGRDTGGTVAAVGELRRALSPMPCVVLDAPPGVRAALDVWDVPDSRAVELMRRVKRRFDPDGRCNPGAFVGSI